MTTEQSMNERVLIMIRQTSGNRGPKCDTGHYPASCRRAFSLIELIGVIGVLLAIGLPAIARSRNAVKKLECVNNLRNIALAMTQFDQTFLRLPASGNISDPPTGRGAPFHSWAVSILPYLDQENLWKKWDFDRPVTDQWHGRMLLLRLHYSPSRRSVRVL